MMTVEQSGLLFLATHCDDVKLKPIKMKTLHEHFSDAGLGIIIKITKNTWYKTESIINCILKVSS